MDTNTREPERVFVDTSMQPASAAASGVRSNDPDAMARSENNILQWMAYLPEDCIRRMIAMGWDVTT